MIANQKEALRLLGAYTGGRFTVWTLAGPAKASCRAHIMSALEGVRVPQSRAGATVLEQRMMELAGPLPGGCKAIREDAFIEWAKAQSERPATHDKVTAPDGRTVELQAVIPGAEPSARQAARARDGRLKARVAQKPADVGLFDTGARDQTALDFGRRP